MGMKHFGVANRELPSRNLEAVGWHVPERSEGRGCGWLRFAIKAKRDDTVLRRIDWCYYELRHAHRFALGRATLHVRWSKKYFAALVKASSFKPQAFDPFC